MENVWVLASGWAGLALVAMLSAILCKISTAPSEIVVCDVAQLVIGAFFLHTKPVRKQAGSALSPVRALLFSFLSPAPNARVKLGPAGSGKGVDSRTSNWIGVTNS